MSCSGFFYIREFPYRNLHIKCCTSCLSAVCDRGIVEQLKKVIPNLKIWHYLFMGEKNG